MPLKLANGCWASDITVHPKNWDKAGASIKEDWQIQYWFHDPAFKKHPTLGRGKQVRIKNGINRFKTLAARREAVTFLIEEIRVRLVDDEYNPITKTEAAPPAPAAPAGPVTEQTPLQLAMLFALRRKWKGYRPQTARDVFGYLRRLRLAAKDLGLHGNPIGTFRRRDLLRIFDRYGERWPWSPATWNNCLGYIKPLFKSLKLYEAIEYNPADDIEKRKKPKKKRVATTSQERARIKEHLGKVDPEFGRVVEIFFHSGGREIELLNVRIADVDISQQGFWVTIYKGRSGMAERVLKTIKDEALPLWIEAMQDGAPDDYVFGLKRANTRHRQFHICPSPRPMKRDVFTRRWQRWVKSDEMGLGIKADAYTLKHSHTTALRAINAKAAQDFNSHKSDAMNEKHYDLMAESRKRDFLREVDIPFADAS